MKTVTADFNGLQVQSFFKNEKEKYIWGLRIGEHEESTSYYEGLLVLKTLHNGHERTFCLATAYWDGVLPIEQPFEIRTCTTLKTASSSL